MEQSNTQVTKHTCEVEHEDCLEIIKVLARIGEKWTVLIIMLLATEPRRFTTLKKSINGISQRMLTVCLRGLERDGLVKRIVYEVMPPHVEYQLTPLGQSLTDPIIKLGTWAKDHIEDIQIARKHYDDLEHEKSGNKKTPWQQLGT